MLSCAAARAFASSLLKRRTAMGADGATPLSHESKGISGTQGWGLEWMRRVWGSRVTMSFAKKKKRHGWEAVTPRTPGCPL